MAKEQAAYQRVKEPPSTNSVKVWDGGENFAQSDRIYTLVFFPHVYWVNN